MPTLVSLILMRKVLIPAIGMVLLLIGRIIVLYIIIQTGQLVLVVVSYSNLGARTFTSNVQNNDEEILKEMMLEMACEGKVYPAMIRMAKRYNDNSFMAKYISEKYETTGNAEDIRSKIMNGDYFIKWNLK